jgi:hypothetical protein
MDLLSTRWVDPVRQYPRTRAYGFFAKGTVPPPSSLLIWFSLSSQPSSPAAFPDPFRRNPEALIPSVRAVLQGLDPNLPMQKP